MKIYIEKPSANTWILYTFIGWLICEFILNTYYDDNLKPFMQALNTYSNYIVLILLIVNILFLQSYEYDELIRIVIISIPIAVATLLSNNGNIMSCWLFIVASKNIEIDRMIDWAEKIFVIMIPLVILLCYFGVFKNNISLRSTTGFVRMSLGFEHANYLGGRVLQLCTFVFYKRNGHFKVRDYVFVIFAIIFVYLVPNSQASYMSIIILLLVQMIFVILEKVSENGEDILAKVLLPLYLFLNFFSIFMGTRDISNSNVLTLIDRTLSRRFSVCYTEVKLFGISILGQNVNISEQERMARGVYQGLYIDNAYLSILIRFGVIVYIIFTIGYLLNMIKSRRDGNFTLFIILFIYSVYGVFEREMYLIGYNVFMLTFATLIYNNKDDELMDVYL